MRENSRFVRGIRFHVYSAAALSLACGVALADTVTTVTTFEYNANGALSAMVRNPDDPKLNLRTQYTYDSWGNRLTTEVSSTATGNTAIPALTVERVTYDTWGVLPVGFTNAVGHRTSAKFDPNSLPLYVDELNGLRTQWEYDVYGRVSKETRPDGNMSTWSYTICSSSTPCSLPNAMLMVAKNSFSPSAVKNGPTVTTYYDTLNRVIRTETQGFDGVSTVLVDTEYDRFGRVYRTSRPYYAGQTIRWTVYSYDVLGRVVDVTGPDGAVVHTSYNGLTMTVTNPLNQNRTTTLNGRGLTSQVIDDAGNILKYTYDAAGRLVRTVDSKGNAISMVYDPAGNKISMTDPDLGIINYVYDALGRLKQQTDAKGQVTTFQYDGIGRVTNRSEPDLVGTWTYDACFMGMGKLCTTSADNGYKSITSYGGDGRVSQSVSTIDKDYASLFTYDANGRLATLQYPSGLKVSYTYTQLGYLSEVRNASTNALYWKANRMDAEGHLLEQAYGNGVVTQQDFDPLTGRINAIRAGANASVQNMAYTYDKRGNVLTRSDSNQNLSESFLYDNLNRITSNTVNSTGAGLVTQTYAYDSIGNITSRSDAGTYTYGAGNTRPHAVAQITRANGSIRQFTYDNSGNLTQEVERDAANNVIAAKGRTETWTSFNMPLTLASVSTSVQFVYGSDHQRIKEINPTYTTYFIHPDNSGGLLYERDVKSTGVVEQRHFITAGGASAVAIVKRDASGAETGIIYLHRDNLGSVTAVTDTAGGVIERMAYEPFGKRRTPAGAMDANGTLAGVNTNRGYTNHEELDSIGFVHMNGRVYDPVIGRFISADPNVPAPSILQSYNRYAYVRNNPLMYVDPTGFLESTSDRGGFFCNWFDLFGLFCESNGGSGGTSSSNPSLQDSRGSNSGVIPASSGGSVSPSQGEDPPSGKIQTVVVSAPRPDNCQLICVNQTTMMATPVIFITGNFLEDNIRTTYSQVAAGGWNAVVSVGKMWTAASIASIASVIGGSPVTAARKSMLLEALESAVPTKGHPSQLMTTLEDGTRVIFRKDFGEQAHPIGGPFQGQGRVDHYNIEIQSNSGRTLENIHAVPDSKGGFIFWGKDGVIKP